MAAKAKAKKKRREPPVTPPGLLATQDLKDRGWTPALIKRFLGEHDSTRPNGLRMGRRRLPPVKLYEEARVLEVERQDAFLAAQARAADARERAERAKETRLAKRAHLLQVAALGYLPVIYPEPLRKGAVRKAAEPYLAGLSEEFERIASEVGKLSQREQDLLAEVLRARLDLALAGAYPWYPSPDRPPPIAPAGDARPSDWRTWDWD